MDVYGQIKDYFKEMSLLKLGVWIAVVTFIVTMVLISLCGCGFTANEKQNVYNLRKSIDSIQTDSEHKKVAIACLAAIDAAIGVPSNPMPYSPALAMYTAQKAEIDAKERASIINNLGGMSAMFLGINLATLPWTEILAGGVALLGGGVYAKKRGQVRKLEQATGRKIKEIEAEEKVIKVKNG